MTEYRFIDKKKLTNIYNLYEIDNRPEVAYSYFMSHEDTIIYVIDEKKLRGIISFGDLERYYKSGREVFTYNENFSYITKKDDFENARVIFNKYKSIFEIPVICEDELIGTLHCERQCRGGVFEEKLKNLCLCKYFKEDADSMEWKMAFKKLEDANKIILYNVPMNREITEYITDAGEKDNLNKRSENYDLRLKELSDDEKELFWESDDWKYSEKQQMESLALLKVIEKNGIKEFKDIKTGLYTIEHGFRRTLYGSNKSNKSIFLFGPCIAFGAFVEDNDTIASYLQKRVNDEGLDYKVINCGFPENPLVPIYLQDFKKNDIAIFINYLTPCVDKLRPANCFYGTDLRTVFSDGECSVYDFLDRFVHCNKKINHAISELIYKDIRAYLTDKNEPEAVSCVSGDKYHISSDVYYYFGRYFDRHMLEQNNSNKNIGSIVMNCNPFTFGHRYLIEYAASKVDELYIFVVEENQSFFKFDDRMKMVISGTWDIPNIHVLPSGKYIISQTTFSQYFEKENVSYVESMDYDVRIFAEVVAPYLGISCRFVGEEIQDHVTKQYNCTLKRILPEYEMDLVEIPRKTLADGEVISATTVRRLMKEGDYKALERYCPKTTLDILNKYSF